LILGRKVGNYIPATLRSSGANMVFGFNTDVEYCGTVYHVQSEERQAEMLLETQIFVGGHCVCKRSWSYSEKAGQPDGEEQQLQEMLKEQHRFVVVAIRDGELAFLLGMQA
jgi:hypothetical protein